MNRDALAVLESRLRSVKLHWMPRLKDEPTLSPLGREGTVEFLMDATFMQLMHGLHPERGLSWLERCRASVAPLHFHFACGVDAVKRYFISGKEALRAGAAEALGATEFEEVVAVFQVLARHETGALCRACKHCYLPSCELQRASAKHLPPSP